MYKKITIKNNNFLDEAKIHTQNKIKYIKDYVNQWLYVGCNAKSINKLNFIDCMCNAGIYKNNVVGTPIEVLDLFIEFSKTYNDKEFNLFLNDIDTDRIKVIKEVISLKNKNKKINIFIENKDVNEYLEIINEDSYDRYFESNALNILFVDPYNFGVVKIKKIKSFLNNRRSELIYNFFSSDFRRNSKNIYCLNKKKLIEESLEGLIENIESIESEELHKIIRKNIKSSKYIRYLFSYTFKTKTNVELYFIIYGTPNDRGLEKIKSSLWNVFDGDEYYKYNSKSEEQVSFFSSKDKGIINLENHSRIAKNLICQNFNNKIVDYDDIKLFILENTMLRKGQIINYVIKPLIKEDRIKKNGNKRSFKNNTYVFRRKND